MFRRQIKTSAYIIFILTTSIVALLPASAPASLRIIQLISTELRYDNNIRAESTGPSDDFSLIISPQIELINERPTMQLNAAYSLTSVSYFKHSDVNTTSHSGTLGMHIKPSATTSLELNDRVTYTKESLDISLINLQTTRNGILANTVSLNMDHSFTSNLSTAVTLSDSVLRFEDPASVDSRTDTASLSLSYSLTPNTSATTSYSYTNYSFDATAGNDASDIVTHSLMLGFRQHITTSLDLDLSAGSTYTPSVENYDWIANAGIRKSFQESSLRLGFLRSTSNTMGLTNQLNIYEAYNVQFDKPLTNTMSVSVSSTYSKNKTSPVATVDIKSLQARLIGAWHPYSWMILSVGYSHFKQWVNGSIGNDISRNHVFINLTATTYDKEF